MSLIVTERRQDAIYWKAGPLDAHGRYTYPNEPIAIKVRWDDINNTIIAKDGTTITTTAMVYVGFDMFEGDFLMLGELFFEEGPDGSGGTSYFYESGSSGEHIPIQIDPVPQNNPRAWEVKRVTKAANFHNTEFFRKVYL